MLDFSASRDILSWTYQTSSQISSSRVPAV